MATPRPRVHIVATGGSISGLGPHRLDYILYPEQRLSIEAMLARIPEAQEVAHDRGRKPHPGGEYCSWSPGVAAAGPAD